MTENEINIIVSICDDLYETLKMSLQINVKNKDEMAEINLSSVHMFYLNMLDDLYNCFINENKKKECKEVFLEVKQKIDNFFNDRLEELND